MKTKPSSEDFKPGIAAFTTDCVIFGFDAGKLKLLLIERANQPFKNLWALPGGFVSDKETTEDGAKRILLEKTGVKNIFIEQLYTFSEINRDPRARIISVAYFALINKTQYNLIAGRNTLKAEWFEIHDLPTLAFDHAKIIKLAFERLQGKVAYQPLGFELLEEKFTLPEIKSVYDAILNKELDRRNFYKKILSTGLLEELQEKQVGVKHKAGKYYRFDKKTYQKLSKQGFHFEI